MAATAKKIRDTTEVVSTESSLPPAHSKKNPWLGATLSLMLPGMGQLYAGRVHLALWLFMLFALISIPGIMLSSLYLSAQMMLPTLLVCVLLSLCIWLYSVIHAFSVIRRQPDLPRQAWQTTGLFVLVFLVCHGLVFPIVVNYIRQNQVQAFKIPSSSMSPTVLSGDYLFADMRYNCPSCKVSVVRGDVAIFVDPNNRNQYHIKRVIGLPGDHVSINSDGVSLNGQPLVVDEGNSNAEKYAAASWTIIGSSVGEESIEIDVPDGMVFVLGDNRENSLDSRDYGPLPLADIVGKARQIWFSSDGKSIRWNRIGAEI